MAVEAVDGPVTSDRVISHCVFGLKLTSQTYRFSCH